MDDVSITADLDGNTLIHLGYGQYLILDRCQWFNWCLESDAIHWKVTRTDNPNRTEDVTLVSELQNWSKVIQAHTFLINNLEEFATWWNAESASLCRYEK